MKRTLISLLIVVSSAFGLAVFEGTASPGNLVAGDSHHWCC